MHSLVDDATVTSIINADVASGAAIAETKISFDGSTVCTLGAAQTLSGDKTLTGTLDTTSGVLNLITSEAAGDVMYNNGTQWVRLAKDAGKYLRSDASAVSWQTPPGSGASTATASFTSADLSSGVYTFAHAIGTQYLSIKVFDNNDIEIEPDSVTATSTTAAAVDLSSYGTITGTWNIRGVG